MGEFLKRVRYGKIPGPHQKGFSRTVWKSYAADSNLEEDEKNLVTAGLFFDDLLSFLRSAKAIGPINLRPSAIARLVVGLATFNLLSISGKAVLTPPDSEQPALATPDLIEMTVSLPTGEVYSPDELITGMGDGMKHIFRELLVMDVHLEKPSEYDADESDIGNIIREFNLAICYQTSVEYWLNCVGNGYVLAKHPKGIALVPLDRSIEIARTVSGYRRSTMHLHENMAFVDEWFHSTPLFSRSVKEKLCVIPLVRRVSGGDRIDHIELGLDKKVLDAAAKEIAGQVLLKVGYYKPFLDDPLPGLYGFTLTEITTAWRLLQSLANVIFSDLKKLDDKGLNMLIKCAPLISRRLLSGTIAKAFSIPFERAETLVNIFVFDGSPSRDLWAQPLVRCDDNYCIVIPCILSVHLFRIVETWMRQGGLDLERRGPEFEQFCREQLSEVLSTSPLKSSVTICKEAIVFKPEDEREEEIDIVIVFSDTLLLIEAKCILWPDDALQIANYRDVVEKAADQIARKRDAVSRNYSDFAMKLRKAGYPAPEKPNVLGCVLSNSAVFSGFPINGVPIVDLAILRSFLINEHVRLLERVKGKTISKQTIKFFDDPLNATKVLAGYLLDPPQLSHMRRSIKSREVVFPLENPAFGKLVYETFSVELDKNAFLSEQFESASPPAGDSS